MTQPTAHTTSAREARHAPSLEQVRRLLGRYRGFAGDGPRRASAIRRAPARNPTAK